MKRLVYILAAAALCALAACQEIPRYFASDRTLARAGGRELRLGDVRSSMPEGLSGEDSAAFLRVYIDRWVRTQLKLEEAEELFSSSEADIDRMVEEYRQALLIRRLDQHYVDRDIDTLFTDEQIAEYYRAHRADFRSDRTLVRGRIVQFQPGARQARKLRELLGSDGAARERDLSDLCAKNGFTLTDLEGQWVDYSEFLSYLPTLRSQNYDSALASRAVQEMRDSRAQYYYRISDVRRPGETIPLELLRPTIRRILFNRRQGEIVRRHEQELYDRAVERKRVRLFVDEEQEQESDSRAINE